MNLDPKALEAAKAAARGTVFFDGCSGACNAYIDRASEDEATVAAITAYITAALPVGPKTAPVPNKMPEWFADAVRNGLQHAWDDYGADTGCHPSEFRVAGVRRYKLSASFGGTFTWLAAETVWRRIVSALSAAPVQADPAMAHYQGQRAGLIADAASEIDSLFGGSTADDPQSPVTMAMAREVRGFVEVPPSPWQPIETAPRDGTRFIGWFPKHNAATTCWAFRHYIDGHLWASPFDKMPDKYSWSPTHWIPLPAPPAGEGV